MDLKQPLKKNFGFDAFRPLQEEIIRASLSGRDTFVLMPTGGGKSLCYQLPAVIQPGLAVVVSPLIALMKDQVDGLEAMGVPATFLNSSLNPNESRARLRGLFAGKYKLLYVSPERALMSGFMEQTQSWSVSLIAIDEAHCISDWGHDFRPEYRRLADLRGEGTGVPLMALTATATPRVRKDIVSQLRLREPNAYVGSFNRPNLLYRVAPKSRAFDQVLDLVRRREGESGIVYCQSRRSTESLAEKLRDNGVAATAYHAGLDGGERDRAQEAFLRDEVNVVCATIAFGMGVNKPNVRFVAHYDLPNNIESYYQQTGRAGRDGLPSECLLLFSPNDTVKHLRFIDEKSEDKERDVARTQLQKMVHFAETADCRRRELLHYFGEESERQECDNCDNCLTPRETFDGSIIAQKLMSSVVRVFRHSGFYVGLNHLIDVLRGADTEKVRRWGHQELSVYGVGADHSKLEWAAYGRELVRLGLLSQTESQMSVIHLTERGSEALKNRDSIRLTRPIATQEKARSERKSAGTIECDEALFEELRKLRKELADSLGAPPYIVFSDVALRQMARDYPVEPESFLKISGVGEKKLRDYGEPFMAEIQAYLGRTGRASAGVS